MSFTESQLNLWLASFIWPLFRVGALVATAPIFSSRQTPVLYRISLVLALTWLMMPLLPAPPVVKAFSGESFLILLQQILIGVTMGFVLQMVFGALVFGGQVVAYSMGLGFASMMYATTWPPKTRAPNTICSRNPIATPITICCSSMRKDSAPKAFTTGGAGNNGIISQVNPSTRLIRYITGVCRELKTGAVATSAPTLNRGQIKLASHRLNWDSVKDIAG